MRRRYRVALAVASFAAAVVVVLGLTRLAPATQGPLSGLLDRAAAAVDELEHRMRVRLSGAGRGRSLAWFEPYRASVDRLRRPEDVLLGAYDNRLPGSAEGIVELERALDTTFPLVQIYTAWGDEPEHQFPLRALTMIWTMGSVPVVTWEPWLSVFDSRRASLPPPGGRDRGGLGAIARGDYDFYVDEWAREAARFGRPFFLRFAHEMNDPYRYPWGPQNNSKEEFVAAWQHVAQRFRRAGAHNVLWVWSPHVAYEYWELWYPGDQDVDWIATTTLNYGPVAQWSRWWTFEDIFETKYPRLEAFGKPVMIAELGSLAVGGDRSEWYKDALTDLPARLPAVKAVLFFNVAHDQTVTMQKVDWTLDADPHVAAAVRQAIAPWAPGRAR
ncbi:MAG TPA: glycosyl hydrolase [Vicinamibacterales bacterium]|nr:glycosyl hydrolase [Vicinamibacterales bacterium]